MKFHELVLLGALGVVGYLAYRSLKGQPLNFTSTVFRIPTGGVLNVPQTWNALNAAPVRAGDDGTGYAWGTDFTGRPAYMPVGAIS